MNVRQGWEGAGAEGEERAAAEGGLEPAQAARPGACRPSSELPRSRWGGSARRGKPCLGVAGTRLATRLSSLAAAEARWASGASRGARGAAGPVEGWCAERRGTLLGCIVLQQMSVLPAAVCVLPRVRSCLFIHLEGGGSSRVLYGLCCNVAIKVSFIPVRS